jgi:hypothetical protein
MSHGSTVHDVLAAYRINEEGVEISTRPLTTERSYEVYAMPVFPGMVIEAHSLR